MAEDAGVLRRFSSGHVAIQLGHAQLMQHLLCIFQPPRGRCTGAGLGVRSDGEILEDVGFRIRGPHHGKELQTGRFGGECTQSVSQA